MEAFLVEAKPWALRQARKRFPHIPQDLYEDVYQQACIEMWQRGPTSMDKRSLYAYLAKVLNGTLGRVHKSWVHDHAQLTYEDGEPIALPDAGPEPDSQYDRRQLNALLSELMNRRLLAPEKAVLQLQLGAGLDPEQVREALDMTPRQYKRRRSEGLEKLRGALDDYLNGRVCDDHAGLLAMAATGELPAGSAEQLHAHLEHCGACRAEIRRLRSTVAARFAFAPWPIAIVAPGWLVAKAGAASALFSGAKAGSTGAVAKLMATAATVAAVAGAGAVVAADSGDDAASKPAPAVPAAATLAPDPVAAAATAEPATVTAKARRAAARQRRRAARAGSGARNASTPAPADGQDGASTPANTQASDAVTTVTETVRQTNDTLRKTTRGITGQLPDLPVPTPDVAGAVDEVTGAVDDATGAVDGLLEP
jgi:RNA polymerase sigma factor (sigma-70 family)